MKLTGNVRLREQRRLFRSSIYILQVEYTYKENVDPVYQSGYTPNITLTDWRDWRPQDFFCCTIAAGCVKCKQGTQP